MRLDEFEPSENVEDRRGQGGGGGGGSGFPIGGAHIGIGGLVIVLIISYLTGINPLTLFGVYDSVTGGGNVTQTTTQPDRASPGTPAGAPTRTPQDQMGTEVARILRSTEQAWTEIFQKQNVGTAYTPPALVLFDGETRSACGAAQSAMGPFYCPNDRKVYLDTRFFDEMRRRFNACPPGEGACAFAQAYVIAHEVGHHVQNLLGILPKVHEAERQASESQANAYSVMLELQADCYAGVWGAHEAQKLHLEQSDVAAALQTAQAIGDDTLQRAARGAVVPDSFTHGSSQQRQHWLMTGLRSGQISACDTFQR